MLMLLNNVQTYVYKHMYMCANNLSIITTTALIEKAITKVKEIYKLWH